MKSLKTSCFLVVFAALHLLLFSQPIIKKNLKSLPVKTINYEQGLVNNSTSDIITDELGFTWVSTKTGMQRYNGYILETINPVIKKEIINITSPVHFFNLQNGTMWISYKDGILEYNPHNNSFKKIVSLPNSSNQSFSLIPVKETNEGIWCLQRNKGLVIYSPSGINIKTISTTDNSFVENVFSWQDIINNTTFATNQNSVFIYNGKDYIQQVDFKTHLVNYINASDIYSFACNESHLFIISPNELSIINIKDVKMKRSISLEKTISGKITTSFVFFPDKNQLLVGLNNHLLSFDTEGNYQKESTNLNGKPLLAQGFIRSIYTDRFNRIWLSTNDDIKRLQDVDIPFAHFVYQNSENNFIRCMYFDEQKHLLLAGCFNGGIQLYDTSGNALWEKAIISENVKDIIAIEKLSGDNYLIETFGRGWYILNLLSKKIKPLFQNKSLEDVIHSHAMNFGNNLQRINDSTLFIATALNIFDCNFKNEVLKSAKPLLPFKDIAAGQIYCFIYSSNKTLWVGTGTGAIYKLEQNKSLQTFQLPENYSVRSFTEDELKHIWVGTDKGLYVYSSTGELLKKITNQSGLLNDCIYAMLPVENKQDVFASSNLGLSFVPLDGTIINYTKESGLQENEFNTGSAIKTANGKYYFGGINGITAFYPEALSDLKDHPEINITRLVVNDSLYNFSPHAWRNDSIILNYDQNHLQIDIAAMGLLNPNEYVYHYRIKGFEQNFQTTNQPTGIKYVLLPGTYSLEISCAPIFSSHSIFKKSFSIIISPPWWQTWWFTILVIVFFIAVIAFVVRQYLHRRYEKKLTALQLQHEIQQERERISRDLHDNLGAYAAAIASNVAGIRSSGDGNNPIILTQLKNNSQSIINQLNDTIWALNKEAISLTAVSDRLKIFLQKIQPNHPCINISIEEKIVNDQEISPASALHLFRIMQEGVNNALKHSEGNCIKILIESGEDWKISIMDNGKGMKNQTTKTDGGNGLKNIKTRAKQSGWQIGWQQNIPCGTSVIISSTTN
ncbi:MAG: hypothetical protein M3Z26_09545 [Bacteroidota bacterium]|nr:hypothetical protein [Bacteroidota bacterium]